MADSVRGVDLLQTELEKAKESLKDVDESIKKLTGRDPTIQRTPVSQRRVSLGSANSRGSERSDSRGAGANRLFSLARRGIIQDGGVKPRAGVGGAFARLGPRPGTRPGGRDREGRRGQDSGEEDELPNRPTLQSSVIATPKEERSRNVSMQEQSKDRKGQARNRRMFGLLLGTLQKFKEDAAESKDKEEQRIKIERKLDEKFKQEKEDIKNERRQLFIARKQKQFRIRLIEQKMEMVANHEDWEKETRKLNNFLRTKAKPHIFFMPKIQDDDIDTKLRDTEKAVEEMIVERRKKLEEEISMMMSQVHNDEDDEEGDDDVDERLDENEADVGDRNLKRERQGDDKENDHDEFAIERERRDKEREERDREKQMRDKAREERMRKRERKSTDGENDDKRRSRSRDQSRDKTKARGDKSREKDRGKDKSRDRHGDKSEGTERSRDRDRHRSGKSRSERHERKKDGEKERSHKHSSSKVKRRSKSDGKVERREKVWEPMEDEEEEEFVGNSKENEEKMFSAKLLEMAGMTEVMKEAKEMNEANLGEDHVQDTGVSQSMISLDDIPRPPEVKSDDKVSDQNNTGETPT